jgi:hypothetical protein
MYGRSDGLKRAAQAVMALWCPFLKPLKPQTRYASLKLCIVRPGATYATNTAPAQATRKSTPGRKRRQRTRQHRVSPHENTDEVRSIANIPGSRSQLHNEIVDFAWRCAPTSQTVRHAALTVRAIEVGWKRAFVSEGGAQELSSLIGGQAKGARPYIKVAPFGSQPCALALPGGDLDLYFKLVYLPFSLVIWKNRSCLVLSCLVHCFLASVYCSVR